MIPSSEKKIDFFIVGTQKGGTTALHAKLARHPDLQCSTKKELHLFDDETRDWNAPNFSDVGAHFKDARPGALWGEATPIYMYWPGAIDRLARYNPAAKLIVSLRHPAWRALSHWKMESARRKETAPFDVAVSEARRAEVGPVHRVYSYVERGFYAAQIAAILDRFPRENLFFCTLEEQREHEAELLRRICRFLGVSGEIGIDGPRVVRPFIGKELVAVPDTDTRPTLERLSQLYHEDIRETAQLTGLPLEHWCDGGYKEHDVPAAGLMQADERKTP